MWPWAHHFTFLRIGFIICQMEIIKPSTVSGIQKVLNNKLLTMMFHVNQQLSTTANSHWVPFSPLYLGERTGNIHTRGVTTSLEGWADSSTPAGEPGGRRFKLQWRALCGLSDNNGISAIWSTQLGGNRFEGQSQIFRDRMSPRKSYLSPSRQHSPKTPFLWKTSSAKPKCNAKLIRCVRGKPVVLRSRAVL